MEDADLHRWEDDGGAVPPEPEPVHGVSPLWRAYFWWRVFRDWAELYR